MQVKRRRWDGQTDREREREMVIVMTYSPFPLRTCATMKINFTTDFRSHKINK